MVVFEVEWSYELDEDVTDIQFVGVFSTRARANEAVVKLRTWPRFRHHPDGFFVMEVEVDKDHSTSGFFTPDE